MSQSPSYKSSRQLPADRSDVFTATIRRRFRELILALGSIALISIGASTAEARMAPPPSREEGKRVGPERPDLAAINKMNRVSKRSNIWMNFTNHGYFGNNSLNSGSSTDQDPCITGAWAPQAEFPGGSGVQYLFQGALWLGAMVRVEGYEYPRVSVGFDGWASTQEFWPGEGATNSQTNGIVERTTLPLQYDCLGNNIGQFHDVAVSEQDFVCSYSDTLSDDFYVKNDGTDGPHAPLGIKITQKSYAWTYNYAQNFIIIDWEIENIAGNYLKNLYVGLYIDADVGPSNEILRYEDDITGFQRYYYYTRTDGQPDSAVINTAWIADNDGRPNGSASGNDFTCPAVTGVRVVRAPNPKLFTSYNWWISNTDVDLDFGPSWEDDGAPAGWTGSYGTPEGDVRKYFVLSNGEFDYDQVQVVADTVAKLYQDAKEPDGSNKRHLWKVPGKSPDTTPTDKIHDLANGYDTRYLLSWGPLGIFDHTDDAGNRIYRLNPGEKFSMTIAYVAGDNFHDKNRPQPTDDPIDPTLFNFASLRYTADWAAKVYDNPMIDTPLWDYGKDHQPNTRDEGEGDGILDTGDGWFGEDVGIDGLYTPSGRVGDTCYVWRNGIREIQPYPGKDDGERDGHLQPEEDRLERPAELDYTMNNEMLDFGDGFPDFRGPPPPPAPSLSQVADPTIINPSLSAPYRKEISGDMLTRNVVLSWTQNPSEDPHQNIDPFSQESDFEGYRIYVANVNLEKDFAFLDQFDYVDSAYFSATDSLASQPVRGVTGLPPTMSIAGEQFTLKPVGRNSGMAGQRDLWIDSTSDRSNWRYYYIIHEAHPLAPRYYAVTAYDYGDYKTGTQPLETAKIANAIFIAPSGSDKLPVRVVPNPYRANADYRLSHGGISWENQDDGTSEFFPQTDRRLYFYNLPKKCLIRIYTVAGDLVDIVPHEVGGDRNNGWAAQNAEYWDLNSRNHQQVVSGLYLFTVEDLTDAHKGEIETGKFVIIR